MTLIFSRFLKIVEAHVSANFHLAKELSCSQRKT